MIYLLGDTSNFVIKNIPLTSFLDRVSFLQVHTIDAKYQGGKKKAVKTVKTSNGT